MGVAQGFCALMTFPLNDTPLVRENLFHAAGFTLLAGAGTFLLTRSGALDLHNRDGFGIVVFGWITAAIAGSLPFLFTNTIPSFSAALFESMSGLTTTGASVIADVERLPRAVLLWRAMTHFFGGMGVLVLVVAILPLIGSGGMSLFRAEMTGPVKNRLTPRIATTAKLLWVVYITLIALQVVLLRLAGMPWFDSVCHSFATLSSGGLSVRNASIGAYNSPLIEGIVVLFMFLSGVNFSLLLHALRGDLRTVWRDSEFRFYLLVWFAVCCFFTGGLALTTTTPFLEALRAAFFTATSVMTTTGFSTVNYDVWPDFLRIALLLVFFLGACAGSTSGSIKMIRILTVFRFTIREIRRWIHPQAVMPVKINNTPIEGGVLNSILGFVLLFIATFAVGSFLMTPFFPGDPLGAISSTATALCNVGLGFGSVGPTENFSAIAPAGKYLLTFFMMLGRLELYTVLVLFAPALWRK